MLRDEVGVVKITVAAGIKKAICWSVIRIRVRKAVGRKRISDFWLDGSVPISISGVVDFVPIEVGRSVPPPYGTSLT